MAAQAAAPGPQGAAGWEASGRSTAQGAGPPRTPSAAALAGMELDEAPGAGTAPGSNRCAADEPPEMRGLLAQLRTLDSSLSERLPAPSCASAAGSPAGGRPRRGGQCQGRCGPCLLHVAMGRGLQTRPCCAQHSACARPCHGLLFAEADREDLLSLLRCEGGLPETSAETPLARSSVLAGTDLELLRAQEELPPAEKAVGMRGAENAAEGPSGGWGYEERLCEGRSTCESNGEGSSEPAWAALPPAAAPGAEQPPRGAGTVSASCVGRGGVESQEVPPGAAPSWVFGWGQRGARGVLFLGLTGPHAAGVPRQDPQYWLGLLLP